MKKLLIALPMLLALVACGENAKIESAVRENLKDPASAQFKDVVISASGNFACKVWNSKNSMGGYGDWDIAELKKIASGWVVTKMQGSQQHCTADHFKSRDDTRKFYEDIRDINKFNQPLP